MNEIKKFCHENKKVLVYISFCVILSYGAKLFLHNYSIDTEYIIDRPTEYLNNDILLSRFTTPTLKYLLCLIPFDIVKTKILTLIMVWVYSLTIIFMVWLVTKGNTHFKIFYYVFIPIFLFHPVWSECFFFLEQSFEVCFGIWLTFLSSACAFRWVLYRRNISNCIMAIILMVLALGTYQVMMPLFITVSISFYLLALYQGRRILIKDFVKDVAKFLAILLFSLIIWQLISKLFMLGYGLEDNSQYISKLMAWGKEPITSTFKSIIIYISSVLMGIKVEYNLGYIVLSLVLLWITWRLRRKEIFSFRVIIFLTAVALIVSPFYLSMIQGERVFIRVQFMLPFCEAWIAGMICVFLNNKKYKKILLAGCVLIAVEELLVTNLLYLTQHKMYQKDVEFTEMMDENIMLFVDNEVDKENITVIFVGTYCPELPQWCIQSECTGHSFYEWSPRNEIGINKRVNMFMNTQGYYYKRPTVAEYREAQVYAENMPVYPEEGFIIDLGEYIIIRLSEQVYF